MSCSFICTFSVKLYPFKTDVTGLWTIPACVLIYLVVAVIFALSCVFVFLQIHITAALAGLHWPGPAGVFVFVFVFIQIHITAAAAGSHWPGQAGVFVVYFWCISCVFVVVSCSGHHRVPATTS